MVVYYIKEYIKKTIIAVLRYAFHYNDDYKFLPDLAMTKITIVKHWPYRAIKLPIIVIGTATGDGLIRTMQDELLREDQLGISGPTDGVTYDGTSGYHYGGGFRITVTVDVAAEDTITREKIIDFVIMYLRYHYISNLQSYGLQLVDMRLTGEHQRLVGDDYVYFDGITVEYYTEWRDEVSVGEAERIESFNLEQVFSLLVDGTTV